MRGSFRTITILAAIPIAGLAVFLLWQWLNGGSPGSAELLGSSAALAETVSPEITPAPQTSPRNTSEKSENAEEPEELRGPPRNKRGTGGDIVLIIDDLGFDGQPLDRLMALDPNINASILPNGTRAAEFAEQLHARGFEILCHLPMEPKGQATPGRNAILTSMSDDEIARVTRENLAAVPNARGVNNHMGSRATADRRVMTSVLRALPDDLYFIDSRTGTRSVAEDVARELNVPTASRHVFLDDVATEGAVRRQVAALAAAAEKRGVAIGIGHPYPVTLRVLAEELPELKARGFRLVRASAVVR